MMLTSTTQSTKHKLKNALYLGVALSLLGGIAQAQNKEPSAPLQLRTDYFGYSLSASARVGYSDNITLTGGPNKNDEIILSTLFSGGAIISTPRVTGILLGDLDFSYLVDQGDFVASQNVGAVSTFTAVDNWLYVDLAGSTKRQLAGDNARFSGNINAGRNQQVNVHSYSASPYLYRQFVDQSSIEARYRFSQSIVDDDANRSINPFGGSTFNDTLSHEISASYDSGGLLNRARFRLNAYGSDVTEDSPDFDPNGDGLPPFFTEFAYRQGALSSDVQIVLTPSFSLSGAVGYDEVEPSEIASVFFSDSQLSGVFWRAGFTATPGRRSNVRIEYGERYGGDFIDADISYQVSSRLRFSASAGRSFRTRTQAVSTQARSNARATLDFADRLREGQELSPRSVIEAASFFSGGVNANSAQTSGVAISDKATASLNGRFGKTNVSLNGFYSDDNFGFRTVEAYGANMNVERRVSRRITAYGGVNYRYADTTIDEAQCIDSFAVFGAESEAQCAQVAANSGVSNNVTGRIGGAYRLYENASLFVEYSHTERFSANDFFDYSENSAFAGVTLDF